jgi:hypothetical protein
MKYLILIIFFLFLCIYFIPCGKKASDTTRGAASTITSASTRSAASTTRGASTSTQPILGSRTVIKRPTVMQNPTPRRIEHSNEYLDKYYNFTVMPFTNRDLENIKGSYMVFDTHDLIQRSPLFNFPKRYAKKSILLQDDIDTVGKIVSFLKSNGNNVGAKVDVCCLQDSLEDVHLLGLQRDVDFVYSRILPSGIEYLPKGDNGKPTQAYVNLIKTRLSQIKRCGFDFVQLGNLDPFSIFNYKLENDYSINPDITYEGCLEFLFDILYYCKALELKTSLSEFSRIFENVVYEMSSLVDYISIYTLDPRTFIKPSKEYIHYFSYKPVFLTSFLNDQVISYFVYKTGWPIEHSILYETKRLFEHSRTVPNTLIVGNRYIDWSFPPKRTWTIRNILTPNTKPPSLPPTLPLYPLPKLSPPHSIEGYDE